MPLTGQPFLYRAHIPAKDHQKQTGKPRGEGRGGGGFLHSKGQATLRCCGDGSPSHDKRIETAGLEELASSPGLFRITP